METTEIVQITENRKKPKTKPNRGRKKPNRKKTEPKLPNRTEPNLVGSVSVFKVRKPNQTEPNRIDIYI
ncbi:hypothetical protein DVH24_042410 [Malus domestica]|uniref:Uncharacterized protein n=1 Tax=Malus domestica TaxID=3750 RepID=A0A498IY17_MALDO|nr:hypothetical protein DVH24_042410 [Malus domestica]